MFKFLMTMWKLNKISEADVDLAVEKAIISEEQGLEIKDTVR
jgi:hypothetical protein